MEVDLLIKVLYLAGFLYVGESVSSFSHMANRDTITLFTGTDPDYSQYRLSVGDRDFLTFSVRACQDAQILISEIIAAGPEQAARAEGAAGAARAELPTPLDDTIRATLVTIGTESNTKTVVQDLNSHTDLVSAHTPNILSCNEYRMFWLSWRNQTLQLGRGPTYEQQSVIGLYTQRWRFIAVITVSFVTDQTTGMWQFSENAGYSSLSYTPPTSLFSKLWRSVEFTSGWFAFSVKALHNAMIGLGAESGIADYQIIIGYANNGRTVLKKNGGELASYPDGLLDNMQWRPFWVSWDAGLIQLGRGRQKNSDVILSYQDRDFQNVGHIGFTSANGATAEWTIRETAENDVIIYNPLTPGLINSNVYISSPTSNYVRFYAQACSDVNLDFTQHKGWTDDSTIHVQIGADNNSQIIIGTDFSPDIQRYNKSDLLDCDRMTEFWASWELGYLLMGVGPREDYNIIFKFTNYEVPHLHSIGFSNGKADVPAAFTVDGSFGDQVISNLYPELEYGKLLFATRGQVVWTFTLTHKGGAKLLLSEALDAVIGEHYEVVFGMAGRTIDITRTVENHQYSNTANLAVPLDQSVPRPFWVSWHGNKVEVGEGHRYGHRSVVSLQAGSPYTVNAVTIGTGRGIYGLLQTPMDQDNLLSVRIEKGTGSRIRWFRVSQRTTWMYLQLANQGEARLSLSTWYRDVTAVQYMLTFGDNGNNRVVLWQNTQRVAESAIKGPWNGKDMRDFWISWAGNKLSVGSTRYMGAEPFFTDLQLSDKLRAIGLSSNTQSDTVEWLIPHSFGTEATVYTQPDVIGETWYRVTHNSGLMFGVQACGGVTVYLTASMYTVNWEPYMVEIGADRNLFTRIWENGTMRMWADSRNLLSCDQERYFWITWYEGAISVGKGQAVGDDQLVTWHGLSPHYITAVTIATVNATGKWRLGFLGGSLDPRPSPPTHKPGLSDGDIAGIVIGVIGFVLVVGFVVYVIVLGVPCSIRTRGPPEGLPTDIPEPFDNPIKYADTEYAPPGEATGDI